MNSKTSKTGAGVRLFSELLLITGIAFSTGCGGGPPQGPPREKTTPVSGAVYIDGELAEGVSVQCVPQRGAPIQYPITAHTDSLGKFKMGTYVSGDGLPTGTYRMTFEKIASGGLRGEKDLLNGRYSKPEKSEFELVIEPGKPVVLDRIELTSK